MFLILLLALPGLVFSASCGGSGIPFRFEVLPSGTPVLGCASPTCFGGGLGGNGIMHDSKFLPSTDGEDGFYRDGDLSRSRNRYAEAPAQQAECPSGFSSTACQNPLTWVGGFQAQAGGDLRLQCCHYDGLRFAAEVGRPIVHAGEVYSGGEVLRDGRQTGFDLISNVKKIDAEDGSVAYELTVTRMNCLPDYPESSNDVGIESNDVSRILDKVGETQPAAQQPQADRAAAEGTDSYVVPPPQDQVVQVGEQVVPVTSAGYYYPVASGVPACFTGDMTVETPTGIKEMKSLKIGDLVRTADEQSVTFTRVVSFLHRLPQVVASFIEITAGGETVKLTPQHFIFKVDCNNVNVREMLYAEDVRKGDCLLKSEQGELIAHPITRVSVTRERGVYSPMTESGDLLVNKIYASCHNVVKESTLSHSFLNFAIELQKKIQSVFGGFDDGHLPVSSEFFLHLIEYIIPPAISYVS